MSLQANGKAEETELSHYIDHQNGLDVRRAILLGSYIRYWGMPLYRTICQNNKQMAPVEVYQFPPQKDEIHRFATVGISAQITENRKLADWEFLFCAPPDFGGAEANEVVNYLLDIMTYSLRKDVCIREGTTIPESILAPKEWKTKALLFDEARGEPEALTHFHFGLQKVDLLWLVPLTESERQFTKEFGLESFDELVEKSNCSILDVIRKPMA